MNFYSDFRFCEAIAASYFPRESVWPTDFITGGRQWKIPAINGTEPITKFALASTFIDFYEPVPLSEEGAQADGAQADGIHATDSPKVSNIRDRNPQQNWSHSGAASATHRLPRLSYLPRASQGLVSAATWEEEQLIQQYQPAPTILWREIGSWENFLARRKKSFTNFSRKQRKLCREIGTVKFTFADSTPGLLQDCMTLKSHQYRNSGEPDLFAVPQHVRFFEEMLQRKLLTVSSLRAGDRLMAVHIGVVHAGRFYYWIPAYAPNCNPYSVGKLLLVAMMRESFEHQHHEFDFLIGNEPYKWFYATHTRLIGEVGTPPVAQRMMRSLKKAAKPILLDALNAAPGLKGRVKAVALKLGA